MHVLQNSKYWLKKALAMSRLGRFSGTSRAEELQKKNKRVAYFATTIAVAILGVSYGSVPLYKAFCKVTGFGGTTQKADDTKSRYVKPIEGGNIIQVNFSSNVHSEMPWKFEPTQRAVKVVPGETALAFFTVKNNADFPITGVATYNVNPPKAGLYFNKIQCFCFEEQRLGAHEEIDMPVFFFIDPTFADDPSMENIRDLTLSYTFFKTGDEKIENQDHNGVVVEK